MILDDPSPAPPELIPDCLGVSGSGVSTVVSFKVAPLSLLGPESLLTGFTIGSAATSGSSSLSERSSIRSSNYRDSESSCLSRLDDLESSKVTFRLSITLLSEITYTL